MKYFIRKCRDEQKHFLYIYEYIYTHEKLIIIYHYENATRTTSFLSINYTYINISMEVLNARCSLNVYFKTRMTITKFIILIQKKIRISCSMSIE